MGRINGKNVLQVVRTVGTGGSETSGCFALNNTHLLVNTQARYYEGALSDIDNREGFSLKAGDTLIGDNNIIYKLISIDETLETFVCLKLWELNNIPTLLIDFSQMYSQNVINLSPEQVELLNTFSVLYLDIPPASDVIHQVIVKNEDTMNNKLSFTGYELDTTNNQVKVNEFLIDTTGNTMTISSITLGASKQLYQHNIILTGSVLINGYDRYFRIPFSITNDSELPFVKNGDYVEGQNLNLFTWFSSRGLDGTTAQKSLAVCGFSIDLQYLCYGVGYSVADSRIRIMIQTDSSFTLGNTTVVDNVEPATV